MSVHSLDVTIDASVLASATASARLSEFPALRKLPPQFAGGNVPGHFLKHVDEQTIVALEAVRRAVERFDLDPREQTSWGIVGAPRFIGRVAGEDILRRFAQGGGATVATHCAAQFSLNSIPGAASIVLGVRGPSVGVGGGRWAIGDGLISALTLFNSACTPGVWLLLTQWEPEADLQNSNLPPSDGVCHAVALVIAPGVQGSSTLQLRFPRSLAATNREAVTEPSVSQIAACIDAAHGGTPANWSCRLPGGSSVEMRLAPIERRLRTAA